MAVTKRRLYSHDAMVAVRSPRSAADAPPSGAWTPDNRNATESDADAETLDAREWWRVRLAANFRDAQGAPVAGGSVNVTPLVSVPDPAGTAGRRWKELTAITGLTGAALSEVAAEGHDVAFRLASVTLSSATDVVLSVTGGTLIRHHTS